MEKRNEILKETGNSTPQPVKKVNKLARELTPVKGPHLRLANQKLTTNKMMIDVLIALTPLVIFAFIKNGIMPFAQGDTKSVWQMLRPLIFMLAGAGFSVILEGLWFLLVEKVTDFKELVKKTWHSYGIIVGLLMAMTLPLTTPFYALFFGCVIGNIVFKMLFGGFGHNLFNPALIGYAVVVVSFGGFTTLNATEINNVVTATPLALLKDGYNLDGLVSWGNHFQYILGLIPGSVAETSALLCVVAAIYLIIRKTINWRTPVFYLATVFGLTGIIALINGYDYWYPVYHLISGGLFFGAVFMATEPVTTPRSPNGKIVFAIGLGVLTVLFRLFGKMNEGVATSILFMCLFTPIIDRICAHLRSQAFSWKLVAKYAGLVLVFVLIIAYILIRSIPEGGAN